ncbi:unnamed protein product [Alopecurus aequalis]
MDNGKEIAVKKLIYRHLEQDSEKQFHNECINLMRVHHQNIVRLVGYCDETRRRCIKYDGEYVFAEENERALCFEYLQGGSLDKHVSDEPCTLAWDTCYKIIKGVCEGLNHLHNGYKDAIFHLDLKPANILLDNNMVPKIGDFGLSRLFSTTGTCTTTTPLGTMGYTPPEYIDKQEISPKFDVFGLGVVIIHIMAGRKIYYDHVDNPSKIIELVCENWEKRLHAPMWSHGSQEVKACIEIALTCVKSNRRERPTIKKIVDDLSRMDIAKLSLTHEATNLENREDLDYNQYTNLVSMGVHDNAIGLDSMEGIDYVRAVSDEVGGNYGSMHDPMFYVHDPNVSIMRDQVLHAIGGHASRVVSDPRAVTQTIEVDIDGHHRRNLQLRAEGSIHTHVTIDTIDNLFQWARSNISSKWSGTRKKLLHDELFHLESGLQNLMDILPAMYDLIDRAEWRSHKHRVAEYLAKLKDTVYDAEDILDEFRWYIMEVNVEESGSQSPSMDFFNNVIQGSFIKLVNGIRDRLINISNHLINMGLHEVTTRFDKSVRPETSSFPDETRIFGRDMELKKMIEFLCKPTNSSSANPKRQKGNSAIDVSTSTSTSNQVNSESSITHLTVLPIVGIGGVGKTTLAQHVCSNAQVKSHFDLIIWVCVSDDFDVKRLTKETIESCPGKQETTGNLNSLQNVLSDIVGSKKFLIVLDDMWDDVLKENGQCWKRFCAPLNNVLQGSVMLVTTRCQKVADRVGTRDPITLEGLKNDVFWNFFKLCIFESGSSNNNYPELERIGRSIVPKLKGSPLAAKTLGRILRMNLQAKYWNAILESELWKLRQEENEILPALRLSYMYLPFHLKRCFSLCAVYPKDYKFQKVALAEIWVAEGFVEPQGDIPVQDIGCEYFNDLLYRSFFQEVRGGYVIHDLLHDMARKVSEFDCFILKRGSDFKSIPPNVRHLAILSSTDIDYSDLLGLRRFTKLRTLLYDEPLASKKTTPSLMAAWCSKFLHLRVILFASTHEIPASIGKLKHLRYLKIYEACPFTSLPVELCWLYNLQIICVQKCKLESLPSNFGKLICLQRFASHGFRCRRRFPKEEFYYEVCVHVANDEPGLGFRLSSSVSKITDLIIDGCQNLSRLEHAVHLAYILDLKKMTIRNCQWLVSFPTERFGDFSCLEELEVQGCPNISSQSLVAPSLKRLVLGERYNSSSCGNMANIVDCCSLTYFFLSSDRLTCIKLQKWNLPALEELHISHCRFLASIIGQSGQVIRRAGGVRAFPSLTNLRIESCTNLSAIDDLLAEDLPAIERIRVKDCYKLLSLPVERFGSFSSLKELEIYRCPCLSWTRGFVLPSSLQILSLDRCGDVSTWVPSCLENLASLATFKIQACRHVTSIPGNFWSTSLTSLENLVISECSGIVSIGGENAIAEIKNVKIDGCPKLEELEQPMFRGRYIPTMAVESDSPPVPLFDSTMN